MKNAKNMIRELYDGNICPQESGIFDTVEFRELNGYIGRHRETLEKELSDEMMDVFEKYMDARNEFESKAEAVMFEYGFKLGLRLMSDALRD